MSERLLEAAVDSMDAWVAEGEIVGGALMVLRHGRVVFQDSVGWDVPEEERPFRTDAVVQVRSMTKPLTSTAILMLEEEGLLDVDDPVARYHPAFETPESREITLRQLLSHTGGLGGGLSSDDPSLREGVARIMKDGPEEEPGTLYRYSDGGSSTLGAVVEEVSGMAVEDFYQTRIFEPLGMQDSFCNAEEGDPRSERVAARYRLEEGEWVRYSEQGELEDWDFCRASGGVYSTMSDWARFMTAMKRGGALEGTRILEPETVEKATQEPHSAYVYSDEERRDRTRFYGFHWYTETDHYRWHPGPKSTRYFSHGGSDGTYALADPEHELVALFFTQSRRHDVRHQFIPLIYEAIVEGPDQTGVVDR